MTREINLPWLEGYRGQTTDQILALDGKYRIDSLVIAFEQGLDQKAARVGEAALTNEERVILAVEALEREVNNGGYSQFFQNLPEYALIIVESLRRIGCPNTAEITQRAIRALGASELTPDGVLRAMARKDPHREMTLNEYDQEYYSHPEPIAEQLLTFIKVNKASINLR